MNEIDPVISVNKPAIVVAWQRWRLKYPDVDGFTDEEQAIMTERRRQPSKLQGNVWDEPTMMNQLKAYKS